MTRRAPVPLLVLYEASLAVLLGYFWFAATGQGAALGWVIFGTAVLACLAAAPRHALIGPMVYVALAYGISSHAPELDMLLSTRVLDGVAVMCLAAWYLAGAPMRPLDQTLAKPFLLAGALFGWILLCAVVALGHGAAWGSFRRHDPSAFLHAGALFFVTAHVTHDRRATQWLAALIAATVLGRALLQGIEGIHLESYVATLLVLGVPVAVLGAAASTAWPARLAYGAAALAMAALLALTSNRAAAVAAAAAAVVLVLQFRGVRLWRALIGLLVVGAIVMALAPASYLQRFAALVDPNLTHATARLDRKTASERMQLWSAGWDMALDHPVVGVGPGNYPAQLGIYVARKPPMAAHSSYVQMLAETGFVGLTLYMLLFLSVARIAGLQRYHRGDAWRASAGRMLQLALVAYLAGGAFNSRHDFVLAYLLAGWALAVCVRPSDAHQGNQREVLR